MKATHQYSSILLMITDNVGGEECLAHSCHCHIPLKIITLSFSTNPITLAKHICLQSPQEFQFDEVSNWTVFLYKPLSPSYLAILLTTPPLLYYLTLLILFSRYCWQFLSNPHCSVSPLPTWLEVLSSFSQTIFLASSLVSLPPACPYLHTTSSINGLWYDSLTSGLTVSIWQCLLSHTPFFSQMDLVTRVPEFTLSFISAWDALSGTVSSLKIKFQR